LFVLNILV